MIGLLVTIFLARRGIGLAKDEANTVSSAPDPNPIFRIATAPDFRRRLGVDSSWPARDIFSFGQVAKETFARLRNPVIALFGALIFVHLLTIGGERASTRILGDALAAGTGGLWIYFAGFLGALGSFFSGSNTISNLTFGPIQLRIAQDLGVSSTTMLAQPPNKPTSEFGLKSTLINESSSDISELRRHADTFRPRLRSLPEALSQVRVGMESALDFRETVAGGQDRVKVRFDRRRDAGRFKPFGTIKWIACDGAPEPGGIEERRDASGVLT